VYVLFLFFFCKLFFKWRRLFFDLIKWRRLIREASPKKIVLFIFWWAYLCVYYIQVKKIHTNKYIYSS
jgi:hypothetical protein